MLVEGTGGVLMADSWVYHERKELLNMWDVDMCKNTRLLTTFLAISASILIINVISLCVLAVYFVDIADQ